MASSRQMREFIIYRIALALGPGARRIVLLLRSRFGLALTAIRDNELAARRWHRRQPHQVGDLCRDRFGTAMVGALIFLKKLRITPDAAFSVNDWTAFVILIAVIGGIGPVEGPILGTLLFFLLRRTGRPWRLYLMILGASPS